MASNHLPDEGKTAKPSVIPRKGRDDDKTKTNESSDDSVSSRALLKRLSGVNVEYEKEQRKTIKSYFSSLQPKAVATFHQEKDEITHLLQGTVDQEELEQGYLDVMCVLFPSQEEREKPDSKSLIKFLQTIFFLDAKSYENLMDKAKSAKVGDKFLNVEVLQGRHLPAMDPDGLSDPFCTLYVTTREASRRTRVATKTLAPIWNESFKFKVNPEMKDFLRIEVWDHDPEERFRDRILTIGQVNSIGGFGNFLADLTHGRRSTQQFMGKVDIPIKDITSMTTEKWWKLKDKPEEGEIYLRLGMGVEKKRTDAVITYSLILRLLVIRELTKHETMVPFQWDRLTEPWGEYLLRQMQTGWGLTNKDTLLSKWVVYTRIHAIFPLSGRIIPPLILEIFDKAQGTESEAPWFHSNDITSILDSAKVLFDFSVDFVEKIHDFLPCPATSSQLYYVLKILEVLGMSTEKLRVTCDNRTIQRTKITPTLIVSELITAIRKGARSKIKDAIFSQPPVKGEEGKTYHTEVLEAERLLHIGQLLIDDLEKGLQIVAKDFTMIMGIDYHRITYEVYDIEMDKIMRLFVIKFCQCLRLSSEKMSYALPPNGTESKTKKYEESSECLVSTTFMKLYLCLQKFSELAPRRKTLTSTSSVDEVDSVSGACPNTSWVVQGSFHEWFSAGITYLFDLMTQRLLALVKNAVEIDYLHSSGNVTCEDKVDSKDNLIPYETQQKNICVTSSAVDSVEIFAEVQRIWHRLNWPDSKQAASFAHKVLQELSGFTIQFANLTSEHYRRHEESRQESIKGQPYHITPRFCRSMNNLHYVANYTKEIAIHLNVEQLLVSINADDADQTDACIIAKQIEIQEAGVEAITDGMFIFTVAKIEPSCRKHLTDIIKAHDEKWQTVFDARMMDFIGYLTTNLKTLEEHLLASLFLQFLTIFWDKLLNIMKQLLADSIKDSKTWEHYEGVNRVLSILKVFLDGVMLQYSPSKLTGCSLLNESPSYIGLTKNLDRLSVPPTSLKSQYLERRFQFQKDLEENQEKNERGFISITTNYQKDKETLDVEVLNCRKLLAADSNGKSDPFVQLQFVPEETFVGVPSPTTKVQKENLFPMFDEKFSIKLSHQLLTTFGGYLRLEVYDHDFLKRNEFLGEALLPLNNVGMGMVKNLLLPLSAPSQQDVEFFKGLIKNRVDRELKKFADVEQQKLAKVFPQTP